MFKLIFLLSCSFLCSTLFAIDICHYDSKKQAYTLITGLTISKYNSHLSTHSSDVPVGNYYPDIDMDGFVNTSAVKNSCPKNGYTLFNNITNNFDLNDNDKSITNVSPIVGIGTDVDILSCYDSSDPYSFTSSASELVHYSCVFSSELTLVTGDLDVFIKNISCNPSPFVIFEQSFYEGNPTDPYGFPQSTVKLSAPTSGGTNLKCDFRFGVKYKGIVQDTESGIMTFIGYVNN